ncbi:redoxin domain-containing protein [bacterium]|nr:MAG: redoxin domain-containing protein [bacterium]
MNERIVLKVNALAPTIDAIDIFERRVRLRDFWGKRVLVAFFRHAGCPFCNVRVHRLQAKHEELKALGLEMIFFFESDKKTLLGNQFHRSVSPIPIIADPEKHWYDMYGIETNLMKSAKSHVTSLFPNAIKALLNGLPVHYMSGNESISTIPAEFLLDEYGMVKQLLYSNSLTDRMSVDTIFEFAKTGKVTG